MQADLQMEVDMGATKLTISKRTHRRLWPKKQTPHAYFLIALLHNVVTSNVNLCTSFYAHVFPSRLS